MTPTAQRTYRFSDHGYTSYVRSWGVHDRRVARACTSHSIEDIRLDRIIASENLIATYKQLKAENGHAPGPDGISFSHLGRQELPQVMRDLSKVLKSGEYQPGQANVVYIPKPSGGTRPLNIRGILDRTVSKAITTAITPALDRLMLPCSFGFRPKLSHHHLLASLAARMELEDLWVIAEDDITKAFDNVPLDQTIDCFRRIIPNQATVDLIESILRGHRDRSRRIGIAQGDPLSPIALNVLLNETLDRPLIDACLVTPFFRFADNLIWICKDVSVGTHALSAASDLLTQSGLTLKGHEPVDLRQQGAQVQLLGYKIRREDDRIVFTIGEDSWQQLHDNLAKAHEVPQSVKKAIEVCEGWIVSHGAAYESVVERDVLDRVYEVASLVGFREMTCVDRLLWLISNTSAKWMRIRESMREQERRVQQ